MPTYLIFSNDYKFFTLSIYVYCIEKLSLETEVDRMVNDMMQKEGWTRSYALSVLRSKFESEERHQEVEYVNNLIRKEGEEEGLAPVATTTNTVTTTNEPSKVTRPPQQRQETVSSKSISRQLDKQTIQINKKITHMLQPLQKQSQLIRQLQSQLKQLQKQVSQIQKAVRIGKKKK
jgi:hypothetical protein